MFTVKATDAHGYSVYQCDFYRYDHNHQNPNQPSYPQLMLFARGEDAESRVIDIRGTVFIMNANGKTVDTFYAVPEPNPNVPAVRPLTTS